MKNAIALGTFDGIHKGHRAVLDLPNDYRKIAVTFSVPPKAVLTNDKALITNSSDKKRILESIGIDEIFMLEFEDVRDMSPDVFLNLLKDKYNPDLITCGFNYRFGKEGKGDINTIKKFCMENGCELRVTEPILKNGEVISSTFIRELLKMGKVEEATQLLTEPFSFETKVIEGDHRGRTIGFPTVNQKYPEELVKLRFGVYKTKIKFRGHEYYGITDIGVRPTYKTNYIISETYIKDFNGNLYGETIRITPLKFLRDEKKFESLEELKKQILIDINS